MKKTPDRSGADRSVMQNGIFVRSRSGAFGQDLAGDMIGFVTEKVFHRMVDVAFLFENK